MQKKTTNETTGSMTDFPLYLYHHGKNDRIYEIFGAHKETRGEDHRQTDIPNHVVGGDDRVVDGLQELVQIVYELYSTTTSPIRAGSVCVGRSGKTVVGVPARFDL